MTNSLVRKQKDQISSWGLSYVVLLGWFEPKKQANLWEVVFEAESQVVHRLHRNVGSTQCAESTGLLYGNHGIEFDASWKFWLIGISQKIDK